MDESKEEFRKELRKVLSEILAKQGRDPARFGPDMVLRFPKGKFGPFVFY